MQNCVGRRHVKQSVSLPGLGLAALRFGTLLLARNAHTGAKLHSQRL